MPRVPMNDGEVARLLEASELLRVAFHDGSSTYLIPLGCVWCDGALYGVMDPGLKSEIAAEHPAVAFQTDTARETGLFEWESVTGNGEFEIVTDPHEVEKAMAELLPFVATAPDWWRAEQGPKMAAGQLLVWRIQPTTTTGVRYIRPD